MNKLNIAKLRKSLKMSQEVFRKEICGISQSYLSELETGKKELTEELYNTIIQKLGKDKVLPFTEAYCDNIAKKSPLISLSDIKEGDYSGTLVYDIDATCGTNQRDMFFAQDNIIGSVNLPGINKNSQIIRANGDSMEPRIFDGNMVVIREIHSWDDLFYGQMYLILLDEYCMIKYIRRYESDEENYIILRSENSKYDDIKLHKNKIRKLFIVENILAIKTQL